MSSYRYKQKRNFYIRLLIIFLLILIGAIYIIFSSPNSLPIIFLITAMLLTSTIGTTICIYFIATLRPEDYPDPPGSYTGPWGLYTPVKPSTPPSTKPQNSNIDHIEKLKDLTQMLEKGYITRAEFEEQKQDILRRRP